MAAVAARFVYRSRRHGRRWRSATAWNDGVAPRLCTGAPKSEISSEHEKVLARARLVSKKPGAVLGMLYRD
jgi:hypothetical protein